MTHEPFVQVQKVYNMGTETEYIVAGDPDKFNLKAILFNRSERLKEVRRFDITQDEASLSYFINQVQEITNNPFTPYCIENAKALPCLNVLYTRVPIFDIHPGRTAALKQNDPHAEKSDWIDCKYIAQAYLLDSKIQQLKLDLNLYYYKDLDELSYKLWQLGNDKGRIKKQIGIRLYKYYEDVHYKKRFLNKFWSQGVILEIQEAFKDASGIKAKMIKNLVNELIAKQNEITEHQKDLEEIANDEVKKLVKNICGCGLLIASRLVAILRQGYKPKNCRSLSKRFGTAPLQSSTGGKMNHRDDHRGRRHGNHLVHQIMTSAIRHDPETRSYFQKCIARGDGEDKAKKKVKNVICRKISRNVYEF